MLPAAPRHRPSTFAAARHARCFIVPHRVIDPNAADAPRCRRTRALPPETPSRPVTSCPPRLPPLTPAASFAATEAERIRPSRPRVVCVRPRAREFVLLTVGINQQIPGCRGTVRHQTGPQQKPEKTPVFCGRPRCGARAASCGEPPTDLRHRSCVDAGRPRDQNGGGAGAGTSQGRPPKHRSLTERSINESAGTILEG